MATNYDLQRKIEALKGELDELKEGYGGIEYMKKLEARILELESKNSKKMVDERSIEFNHTPGD